MVDVRLATPEDRADVLRLVRSLLIELGGNPAPAETLQAVFTSLVGRGSAGFIVVGEEDGETQAVCTVSFIQALRTAGRYAVFQEMYVEPRARGSGIGRAVLEFAIDHAEASGCQVMELGTPRNGQRTIGFYERAGFENIGARMRWKSPDNRYR